MENKKARKSHCKCGSPLTEGGITTKYRYCVPCTRRRAVERRRSNAAVQIVPVEPLGARDRLRKFIERDPVEAISAILDFVADRRTDYLGGQAA